MSMLNQIADQKIVAVIRLDGLSKAVELSQALLEGGVSILEFTLTNADAPQAIKQVRKTLGDRIIVGAGSVITSQQVDEVADCGAQFVVSPVTKRDVIESCHKHQLPTMPGAYTPTEIQAAWEMDVAAVKVFPAAGLGVKYIKDVLAPLPHLRLIPTGGITVNNIMDFVNVGVFAVGVGSALFDKNALKAGDWDSIAHSAKKLCQAIK